MSDELDIDLDFNQTPFDTRECPDCGEDMFLLRNMSSGGQFFGCSAFPACRKTLPLVEPEWSDRKPRWGWEGTHWDDTDNDEWWKNEIF